MSAPSRAARELKNFDANISITVEWSHVECKWCGATPSVLVQIDGGDCEDYIGRFLCRKHFNALRRYMLSALRLPEIPAEFVKAGE